VLLARARRLIIFGRFKKKKNYGFKEIIDN
jgi:hypothetical protein